MTDDIGEASSATDVQAVQAVKQHEDQNGTAGASELHELQVYAVWLRRSVRRDKAADRRSARRKLY